VSQVRASIAILLNDRPILDYDNSGPGRIGMVPGPKQAVDFELPVPGLVSMSDAVQERQAEDKQ